MKKRLLAIFTVLMLVLSLFPAVSVFAATAGELQLLIDLGIVEELQSTGLKEANYSRSKFARSLIMMTNTYAEKADGVEGAAGGGDIYVSTGGGKIGIIKVDDGDSAEDPTLQYAADITKDTNNPSIMRVIEHGYMETDEAGNFRPGDSVTKMEATRALLRALNYGEIAEENGGTDAAYLSLAAKLGLFRRVTVLNDAALTTKDIAGMIANAMQIQIYYTDGVDLEDKCFFELWDLKEHSGKLLANSSLGLMIDRAPSNHINVGGKLFRTGILIPNELVGCQVTFYTRETEKGETVVSIFSQGDSEVITLKPGDIEMVRQSGNTITVYYGKDETLKATSQGYAMVNGKTMSPSKELLEALDCGSVTFVDSDSNGIYDVLHIELLETIAISGVATDMSKLVTKFYRQTIDLKAYETIEIYLNNKQASIEDLETNMLVDIGCDAFSIVNGKVQSDFANGKHIKIYGKTKTTTGCVVSIEDNRKLYIDDMDYEFGNLYYKLIDDGFLQAVKAGDYIHAQFDSMGRLAYYEVDTTRGKTYGYLIATGKLQKGLSNVLDFRILTTEGQYITASAADKLILDGSTIDKKNVSLTYMTADGTNVDLSKRQVIRYRLSEEGLLRELDTAGIGANESTANSLTQDLALDPYGTGAGKVSVNNTVIDKKYVFADDCVAFLDSAPLTSGLPNERLIQCIKVSSISGDQYLAGYDANEMKELSCVVRYDAYGVTGGNVKGNGLYHHGFLCYVVDSILSSVEEDGSPSWIVNLVGGTEGSVTCRILSDVTRLYITTDNKEDWGKEYSWVLEQNINDFMSLIGPGDIVRYTTNFYDQVTHFERLFDFSEYGSSVVERPNAGGMTMCFANVEAAYGNGLVIYSYGDAVTNPGTETYLFKKLDKLARATIFDVARGKARQVAYQNLPSALTGEKTSAFIRYYDHDNLLDYIFYVYE